MANSLHVLRRQKKSSGIWIWCILLKLLMTFPCVFLECLGVNIPISIYPSGDINLEYGSPLELYCKIEDSSSTSENLVFSRGAETIHSEVVNITTRRLYIAKPEKELSTYFCKNKDKICPARVLVDSSPSNITDFRCISHNLDVLNCSWSSPPDSYSKIEFVLKYQDIYYNKQLIKTNSCQISKNYNTWFCIWNATTQPRYRQEMEYFTFNLTSCNRFGCNYQKIQVDHFAIVKPDKPIIFEVLPSPHSVTLKWNISFNMVDLLACGVDHKIEYQIAEFDDNTTYHPVDTSKLLPNKTSYELELKLPYAHMQYKVRIYIKSKRASDKYWSDFSYIGFSTTGERTKMPFDQVTTEGVKTA